MNPTTISNKRRIIEIIAVLITAAGKFVFIDQLKMWLPFVVPVIIAWTAYIIYRHKMQPGIIRYWGFRTDNFKKVMRMVLPFGLAAVAGCIALGLVLGAINVTWHIIPILFLYPIWGVIQQFLLIALTAGNLNDMKGRTISRWVIIILSALLFGLIHYPFYWLILGSFVLALFYGWVYLRERNIYVLGLFHGWLGAIFFYTVVGRDPFVEVFGFLTAR